MTEPDPSFLCSAHPHTRTQNTRSKGPLEVPLRFARTKKVRGTGCLTFFNFFNSTSTVRSNVVTLPPSSLRLADCRRRWAAPRAADGDSGTSRSSDLTLTLTRPDLTDLDLDPTDQNDLDQT